MSLSGNSITNPGRHKALEKTNLLLEENGHDTYDGRKSRRHSAREEIRVLFQKLAVTEQVGEPLHRTRKYSPDEGPIPKTRIRVEETVQTRYGGGGTHPIIALIDEVIGWYE